MGSSGGGVFLPSDPPPSTGQVLTNPVISGAALSGTMTIATGATITNPTITGAVISGTVTVASGATLTTPVITGATISGTVTVASGATLTTPSLLVTTALVTATGATGGSGAALTAVTPQAIIVTGATGSGVDLPTGPAGLAYYIQNVAAATMRFYCVGGTINGTTGTTAYTITNTGNKAAWAFNTSATGAWFVGGNT